MNITDILRKYGIHLKDSLGQNFIKDERILSRIVKDSGITDEATVIENRDRTRYPDAETRQKSEKSNWL